MTPQDLMQRFEDHAKLSSQRLLELIEDPKSTDEQWRKAIREAGEARISRNAARLMLHACRTYGT